MTKITVDKALIEQVLEALTEFTGSMTVRQHYTNAGQMVIDALPALRAALAEPTVEPDDQLHCDICGDVTDDPWHFSTSQDRHKHACDQCWESLKESDTICKPPAETVVEQCGYDETTGNCTKNPCCYTSPPPQAEVPLLSNELIDTLADAHRSVLNGSPYFAWYDYARKIEQAVRQKAGL